MLDEFLEVAYTSTTRKQAEYELVGLLQELPGAELRKIAAGTPVAELYGYLDKTAYLDSVCGPDGQPKTFLDKFKGTPLFEQAVALEQQELQAEMTDMAKRQERRQLNAADDSFYDIRDRLRVQKRLLELELAKQEAGAPTAGEVPPGEPAQGAGAPGPVPPEGVEAGAGGVVGKTASKEKTAHLLAIGDAAGRLMAKTALAIPAGLSGMAGKALGWAAKNPGTAGSIAGAGLGAAGGALAGGPDHRLSGALGGATLGAGVGGMGAGTLGRMHAGQGLGQAATNTVRSTLNTGMRGVNAVTGGSGRLSTLAQNVNQRGHDLLSGVGGTLSPKA